jgi:hypothetical protein
MAGVIDGCNIFVPQNPALASECDELRDVIFSLRE